MPYNKLTAEERQVIEHKGTEIPFKGKYDNFYKKGTYVCRKCNNPLYSSKTKFDAGCGWPAFDDHFEGSVEENPAMWADWAEIVCANCKGHLGHVFYGEKFTEKDTRHCVNSVSIHFISEDEDLPEVLKPDAA